MFADDVNLGVLGVCIFKPVGEPVRVRISQDYDLEHAVVGGRLVESRRKKLRRSQDHGRKSGLARAILPNLCQCSVGLSSIRNFPSTGSSHLRASSQSPCIAVPCRRDRTLRPTKPARASYRKNPKNGGSGLGRERPRRRVGSR
jgi:hypothetical protein